MKTIFIILSLMLVGCSSKPPLEYLYAVDTDNRVCAKKEIVSYHPITVRQVEDLPLEACNGALAISRQDYLPFKEWLYVSIEDLKGNCKRIFKYLKK